MFYLSRENNQTKEYLYSNIFFSLENVLPQLFGFFFIFTLQITIITSDTAVTG